MKLATPRWWYARGKSPAPVARALSRPLSWAWAAATARRLRRGRPVDPGVPVISIGNLTVGGSGKTPVSRAVLERLRAAGVEAHGVSRGYGGRLKGPVRVYPQRHGAAEVGDEPLMLARDGLPIWVARDRAAGAVAAVQGGARALVLDDAHQNPALVKALSLVVVDGETREGEWPFGDGSVFPAGPMREPLGRGLARADAAIVLLPAGLAEVEPELAALLSPVPVLTARLAPTGPSPAGPQLAFAGIAKPWKFERSLIEAGVQLADFAPFADHAPFRDADLRFLAERAARLGAALLTTEKDWVRLPEPWRSRVGVWPVEVCFDDEAGLQRLLQRVLRDAAAEPA